MSSLNVSNQDSNYNLVDEINQEISSQETVTAFISAAQAALSQINPQGEDIDKLTDELNQVLEGMPQEAEMTQEHESDTAVHGQQLIYLLMSKLQDNELQQMISSSDVSEAESALSLANSKVQQDSFNQIVQDMNQHHSFWKKMLHVVVKAAPYIIMAAGALSGNAELVVGAAAVLAMTKSGAVSGMSNEITKGLEAAGVSKGTAEMLAGVITVVIVAVATLGVGAAASLEVAGEEVGEGLSDEAAQKAAKKISVNMSKAIGASAIGGATATGVESSTFSDGLVRDLGLNGTKAGKIIRETTMIIMDIIALVAGIAGGAGLASESENASLIASKLSSSFSEMLPEVFDLMSENSEKIASVARTVEFSAALFGGSSEMALSGTLINQAKAQKDIGKNEAAIELLRTDLDINEMELDQNGESIKTAVSTYSQIWNNVSSLSQAEENAAQILAH